MSTYNGEKYIRMQLDSILGQTYENLCLLIRDDGSTDQTVSILEEYAKRDNRITYYTGKNIGVIQSFLELVKNSSEEAGYYAFACGRENRSGAGTGSLLQRNLSDR